MATHTLPGTQKQIAYARQIASRQNLLLPWDVQMDRSQLSEWISAHAGLAPARDPGPSSKQVAFAEKLARRRHVDVPDECLKDRGLMSRWIDHNRV
jgi:hypothetical protein